MTTPKNEGTNTISKGRFTIQEIVVQPIQDELNEATYRIELTDRIDVSDQNEQEYNYSHTNLRKSTKHMSLNKRFYHKAINFDKSNGSLNCFVMNFNKKEWLNFHYIDVYLNHVLSKNKFIGEEISKNSNLRDTMFNNNDNYFETGDSQKSSKSVGRNIETKDFKSKNIYSLDTNHFIHLEHADCVEEKPIFLTKLSIGTIKQDNSDLAEPNPHHYEQLEHYDHLSRVVLTSPTLQPKSENIAHIDNLGHDLNLNLYSNKQANLKHKKGSNKLYGSASKEHYHAHHAHHNKNINSVEINFRNNLIKSPMCSPINRESRKINIENILCGERKISYCSQHNQNYAGDQVGGSGGGSNNVKQSKRNSEEFDYENMVSKYEKILNNKKTKSSGFISDKFNKCSEHNELANLIKILKKRKKKSTTKKINYSGSSLIVQNVYNYNYISDITNKVTKESQLIIEKVKPKGKKNNFVIDSNSSMCGTLNSTHDHETIEKVCS